MVQGINGSPRRRIQDCPPGPLAVLFVWCGGRGGAVGPCGSGGGAKTAEGDVLDFLLRFHKARIFFLCYRLYLVSILVGGSRK